MFSNYYKFEDCINHEAAEVGPPDCNEKTVKLVDQLLEGFTGEMLNFICSEYNKDTDRCVKIVPQTPKKNPDQIRPKSILPAFIDLLESIK